MNKGKSLLFITTRLFFVPNSGRKVSLFHFCRGLSSVYNYNIHLYSFLESGQTENEIKSKPDFIRDVNIAEKVNPLVKLRNILFNSVLGQKLPLQCSLFYSKANVDKIKKLVQDIKPDVIIVDMIRLAPYYEALIGYDCLKVIDLDDLLSKRYERQLSSSKSNADFTGQYGKGSSKFMSRLVNLSFIKNAILRLEIKRTRHYEKHYYNLYDKTTFISQNETKYMNGLMGQNKAVTVTTGCDYAYFSENISVSKKENTLSFLGNMNVASNADTLDMMINCVLPKIKHNVILIVIGKTQEEQKLRYRENQNIIFTGQVDDLRPHIKGTEIFLSPIAYGSGIKTKILEAMAMGMPIVTNSVGAEGINIVNGEHLFVYDDFDEIASCVDVLLDNKDKIPYLAENARKLIEKEYQWEVIWESFREVLDLKPMPTDS